MQNLTRRMDDEPPEHEPDIPEPEGPEIKEPEGARNLGVVNELEHRLLKQRKVLIFGAINDRLARDVTGRLLARPAPPRSRSTSISTRRAATWKAATRSTT